MNPENWRIEKKTLHVPPLEEIATALNRGLRSNFEQVEASVVECPDLTQQPFTLACKGLNGTPKLIDFGGLAYAFPVAQKDKVYDVKDFVKTVKTDPAFVIGAAGGPHPYTILNSDGVYNLEIKNGNVRNLSQTLIVDEDGKAVQGSLPDSETRCAALGNFLICNGKPGKVVKVHVKKRTGSDDFVTSIRKVLVDTFKGQLIGLGGTFLLKEGKINVHITPDFSKTPIVTVADLNAWKRFFDLTAPLVAVGTVTTNDGGIGLSDRHFHSFSHHGEAGHYQHDITPDTVEYLGYFVPAEEAYRIDRPEVAFKFK